MAHLCNGRFLPCAAPVWVSGCLGVWVSGCLGVVPKKGNRWRMILHLSAAAGSSVNDHIPREPFSLLYSTTDDAVCMLMTLGTGALMVKADLKSAFRMIPVRPQDWELLGMQWRDHFYHDTCLPFGLRSAPFLIKDSGRDGRPRPGPHVPGPGAGCHSAAHPPALRQAD